MDIKYSEKMKEGKKVYVRMPNGWFPVTTMTELIRISFILFVARYTGSDGNTVASLKFKKQLQ